MEIYFKGKHYTKYIGESVSVNMWNTKKQQSRVTASYPDGSLINSQIEKWKTAASETIEHFKDALSAPSSAEFKQVLERKRYKENFVVQLSLVSYMDTFIERYESLRSTSRIKHYRMIQNRIMGNGDF